LVAKLNLRLRCTNSSGHTVILAGKFESPSIVRAARNTDAANRREFDYAPDVHSLLAEVPPEAPPFGETHDPKLFVMLATGESLDVLVQTSVFALTNPPKGTKGGGLLSKGSYVLQVGIHTWPYDWPNFTSKTDLQRLRQRWIKYGELATGLVDSDFAPFTLPER
jgi:hypothetical protein